MTIEGKPCVPWVIRGLTDRRRDLGRRARGRCGRERGESKGRKRQTKGREERTNWATVRGDISFMFRTKSRASSKALCKEHQASAQRAIRKRREAKEKRGLREWEWERKRHNTFNTLAGPEDGLLGELELVALIVLSESCETFSGRGEEGQCFEGPRAGREKREEGDTNSPSAWQSPAALFSAGSAH